MPGVLLAVYTHDGCCCEWQVLRCAAAVQLLRSKDLSLSSIRFFVIDECDKVLDKTGVHKQAVCCSAAYVWMHATSAGRRVADQTCCADMRSDVQNIFKSTPHSKQVMMFSATLSKEIRPVCKKFMNEVRSQAPGWRTCPPA